MNVHFIAFDKADQTIFGIGSTEAEARADAREWLDRDEDVSTLRTCQASDNLVAAVRSGNPKVKWLVGWSGCGFTHEELV